MDLGTLFPKSSKKVARAINSNALVRRPLVVLANLAGFDGSPESMRRCSSLPPTRLAAVNFSVARSSSVSSPSLPLARVRGLLQRLNEAFETIAVEGAKASVIGGPAAAGAVFTRDVTAATRSDARVVALEERIEAAEGADASRLRGELSSLLESVRSEKMGELAAKFDAIHSIQRAVEVGSVSSIVAAGNLAPT